MKTQELNLTKEDKVALFSTLTDFYIAVKGKGMFRVVELEEYKPEKQLKRDSKGRFVKR